VMSIPQEKTVCCVLRQLVVAWRIAEVISSNPLGWHIYRSKIIVSAGEFENWLRTLVAGKLRCSRAEAVRTGRRENENAWKEST